MTKVEFLNKVNDGRYPKYKLSDVHTCKPRRSGTYIVCTSDDELCYAYYVCRNHWSKVHIYNIDNELSLVSQRCYYTALLSKVIYWIGKCH